MDFRECRRYEYGTTPVLVNRRKCGNLHGWNYDVPYPRFGFSNTRLTVLEMLIIVINILSRSGGSEWHTSPGKGLLKEVLVGDRRCEMQRGD